VEVVVGDLEDAELVAVEELPGQVPDVVGLEVERLEGPLEVENVGRHVRQGKVCQVLKKEEEF
jgi:hypothetical protein